MCVFTWQRDVYLAEEEEQEVVAEERPCHTVIKTKSVKLFINEQIPWQPVRYGSPTHHISYQLTHGALIALTAPAASRKPSWPDAELCQCQVERDNGGHCATRWKRLFRLYVSRRVVEYLNMQAPQPHHFVAILAMFRLQCRPLPG